MRIRAACLVIALSACGRGSPPAAPSTGPTGPTSTLPAGGSGTLPTAASATATTATTASGTLVGTAHPIVVEAAARDGSWVVICQARADTDGDGEIAVHTGHHGDTYGDRFEPYVVRGAGAGELIDSLVGHTRDGRWLVVLRAGKLALLDARTGAWSDLPGADVRDDGVPLGPHRAASVARAGDHLTYFHDDETIVVRELSSGTERLVKVPGARVWRVEVEPPGEWALVYVIRTDSDKDGKLTWPSVRTSLSDRDCRGPIASYSTGGWSGDKPDQLWLELATGVIGPTRAAGAPPASAASEEAALGSHLGREILAIDRAGRRLMAPRSDDHGIPMGPLEWVTP